MERGFKIPISAVSLFHFDFSFLFRHFSSSVSVFLTYVKYTSSWPTPIAQFGVEFLTKNKTSLSLDKFMEIPNLNSEETKNPQKISVCSQPNGLHYTTNSDSFVIDMNGFSNGGTKLQRNLSRKGTQRGGDKIIAMNSSPVDRDSPSPTVAAGGATMAEKAGATAATMAVGSQQDHLGVPQVHHQITVTTGNTAAAAPVERAILRRNSFRRPPSSWFLDPKKVLLFFATVSCIGSMLLIYFTLAIGKPAGDRGFD